MNIPFKDKLEKFCHGRAACSCWFDGIGKLYWGHCCVIHDIDVPYGRTKTLNQADLKLAKCVWEKSKIMAVIMYIGVRTFSWIYWRRKVK